MFKLLLKGATIFYYFTFQQLFNILGRGYWYARIFLTGNWEESSDICKNTADKVKDFTSLNNIYMTFKYQYDGVFKNFWVFDKWPTWIPTMQIIANRGTSDNCDGAVVYAKFLYKALFKKHPEAKQELKLKLRIMVPYDSFKNFAYRTHYVLEVVHEKEGWSAIYSSGKIYAMTIDEFVPKYVKTDKFIIW